MFTGSAKELTDLSRRFTEPANATHRQYEALRAYLVEGLSGVEAARRFGYTPGSFRVLVHQFRRDPNRIFFTPPAKGPQAATKADPVHDRIIALRKPDLSIYDISRALHDEGRPLGPVAVSQVLKFFFYSCALGFDVTPFVMGRESKPSLLHSATPLR